MNTTITLEAINKIVPNDHRWISENTLEKITKSEYNQKAILFLINTATTCDIRAIGLNLPTWGETLVNSYRVTLKNKKSEYTFTFYDSIKNTEDNKGLTYDFYSVLACLNTYCPDCFLDFGYEFHTEEEYIKTKQVHIELLNQTKELKKLFTNEQLEQLNDIN